MLRPVAAVLVLVTAASSASAEFVPTVLDRFDGVVAHTAVQDGGYSPGADNIAGAIWQGFGATGGMKSFRATYGAESTGYSPNSVFASMGQSGGMLSLGLVVPAGNLLSGGGSDPASARLVYSGAFDLSGKGGVFYFSFAAASASDAPLLVGITQGGVEYTAVVATVPNGPRHVELGFSSLVSTSGAAFAGDGSGVTHVFLASVATADITSNRTASLSEFGIVPAPATMALLPLVVFGRGARRR